MQHGLLIHIVINSLLARCGWPPRVGIPCPTLGLGEPWLQFFMSKDRVSARSGRSSEVAGPQELQCTLSSFGWAWGHPIGNLIGNPIGNEIDNATGNRNCLILKTCRFRWLSNNEINVVKSLLYCLLNCLLYCPLNCLLYCLLVRCACLLVFSPSDKDRLQFPDFCFLKAHICTTDTWHVPDFSDLLFQIENVTYLTSDPSQKVIV